MANAHEIRYNPVNPVVLCTLKGLTFYALINNLFDLISFQLFCQFWIHRAQSLEVKVEISRARMKVFLRAKLKLVVGLL